mmetsp:Transcript_11961/g.38059  ORF Transcript_11961/g.38059 Transcript_11961/m.38059 type:complete len:252 (+) Transcript_11961:524-1279(+)
MILERRVSLSARGASAAPNIAYDSNASKKYEYAVFQSPSSPLRMPDCTSICPCSSGGQYTELAAARAFVSDALDFGKFLSCRCTLLSVSCVSTSSSLSSSAFTSLVSAVTVARAAAPWPLASCSSASLASNRCRKNVRFCCVARVTADCTSDRAAASAPGAASLAGVVASSMTVRTILAAFALDNLPSNVACSSSREATPDRGSEAAARMIASSISRPPNSPSLSILSSSFVDSPARFRYCCVSTKLVMIL